MHIIHKSANEKHLRETTTLTLTRSGKVRGPQYPSKAVVDGIHPVQHVHHAVNFSVGWKYQLNYWGRVMKELAEPHVPINAVETPRELFAFDADRLAVASPSRVELVVSINEEKQ